MTWLDFGPADNNVIPQVQAIHYDDGTTADVIQMDTASIRSAGQVILNQVIRGSDAMGVHFSNLATASPSYCLCDVWDSSIPGLTDELGALGNEVLSAFNAYLTPTVDAVSRASGLDADQAQASAVSTVGGGVDAGFGGLLASAIVNDANNQMAATWLDGPAGPSQVDLLLAMQGQSGSSAGLAITQMMQQSNYDAVETWLAPEGTSYVGQDDSGSNLYEDDYGDVGTMSDIHVDTYDENYNGSSDDYNVD